MISPPQRHREHREAKETVRAPDPLTNRIIGFAISVYREPGPGLLESAYEECLCLELRQSGIRYVTGYPMPWC